MMGQHTAQIDEESLQKTGCRRRNCLDVFLVTSIVLLFMLVAAVAAVVGVNVMAPQPRSPEFPMPERMSDGPYFKVRIGSHLEKKKKLLSESFLVHASVSHVLIPSVFILFRQQGQNFVYLDAKESK